MKESKKKDGTKLQACAAGGFLTNWNLAKIPEYSAVSGTDILSISEFELQLILLEASKYL